MDATLELDPRGWRQDGGDLSRRAAGLTESRVDVSVKKPYRTLGLLDMTRIASSWIVLKRERQSLVNIVGPF